MSDIDAQMDAIKLTYDKRRKGHKFSYDGMEMFFKGSDTEKEKEKIEKQINDLLSKEKKEPETIAFSEGGLKDEGGTVDPVSGNEVPPGSTQSEVRDDIPAQLSEGEFVFPADVVRYIGLENLMQLRQKAKQGLAQMEAMGQMGNSDEATMSDTEPFEGEIDALIDEFDPDNPDTFEFNLGGVVPGQLTSSQTTPIYQPPATLPSFTDFIQQPAQQQAQSVRPVVEQREYVGPNGERITIQFVNGKEVTPIPDGYVPFDPTAQPVTPEVVKPEVIASQEDSSDDRERQAERDAQMARDKEISNTLASYDEEFAEQWAQDPFNTGKIGNPYSAIATSVQTHLGRTSAIERIAEKYDIDLDRYTNKGIKGVFSKYDDEAVSDLLQEARTIERDEGLSSDESVSVAQQRSKTIEAVGATASQDPSEEGSTGGQRDQIAKQQAKAVDAVGSTASEDPSEEGSMGNEVVSESSGTADDVANEGGLE